MKKLIKLLSVVMALVLTINFVPATGIQAATTTESGVLTIEIPTLDTTTFHYQYIKTDEWDSGFTAGIELRNDETDSYINNWYIQFDIAGEITDIWNGEIVSHTGNQYVIKYVDYNQKIAPLSKTFVGFNVSGEPAEYIDNVVVYGVQTY